MTAEDNHSSPSDRPANACGVASVALGLCLVFYYALGVANVLTPQAGLITIWAITVIGLAFLKINTWIVDRRISAAEVHHAADHAADMAKLQDAHQRTLAELQKIHTLLERFGGEALEAARNAGKWEGFTTGIRDNGDTSEVVRLHRRGG